MKTFKVEIQYDDKCDIALSAERAVIGKILPEGTVVSLAKNGTVKFRILDKGDAEVTIL